MEIKPGYKQTEIGVIPEDWDAIKLGKLSTFVSSGKSKKRTEHGEYHFYGSTGIIGYCDTPEYDGERILIARVGANAGSLYTVDGRYSVSDNTLVIGLKDSHLTGYIANYLLKESLNRIVFGSGQPLVTGNQLKNVLIAMPSQREEIDSIVEAISNVAALITSLEKLIEKKKLIKQGVMQELLTGKRRLPGFSGDWVTKRLRDIADVFSGGTPSTSIPQYWSGAIHWFTPTEIGSKKYVYASDRTISELGLMNSSAKLLPEGAIILTTRASIGDVSIMKCRGCTNQGCQSLVTTTGYDYEFLYYKLLTQKNVMMQYASGSTFVEVSPKKLKEIKISMPEYTEQKRIAEVLSDLDSELELLVNQREKLQLLKQAMMQELLTGRIRLI